MGGMGTAMMDASGRTINPYQNSGQLPSYMQGWSQLYDDSGNLKIGTTYNGYQIGKDSLGGGGYSNPYTNKWVDTTNAKNWVDPSKSSTGTTNQSNQSGSSPTPTLDQALQSVLQTPQSDVNIDIAPYSGAGTQSDPYTGSIPGTYAPDTTQVSGQSVMGSNMAKQPTSIKYPDGTTVPWSQYKSWLDNPGSAPSGVFYTGTPVYGDSNTTPSNSTQGSSSSPMQTVAGNQNYMPQLLGDTTGINQQGMTPQQQYLTNLGDYSTVDQQMQLYS
jgi:hypothetical protein